MVSTFGTVNALTMAGARAYYAIAKDGLFFSAASRLNRAGVLGWGLMPGRLWSVLLVLPWNLQSATGGYGNLYSNLLDYVISAALVFYILTIFGIFRLRRTRPLVERPYRTWGYPWLPALYIAGATVILLVLFAYRPGTTWPGMAIVAAGAPVYFLIRRRNPASNRWIWSVGSRTKAQTSNSRPGLPEFWVVPITPNADRPGLYALASTPGRVSTA